MKKLIPIVLTFILATPISSALAKDPIRILTDCSVTQVSDGDTLAALCGGTKVKIRLYGIDAPETEKKSKKTGKITKKGQPFGAEAQKALEGRIGRQKVKFEVMTTDRYKRLVSVVKIGERNLNHEMVAEGWAWAYRQYLGRPYKSEFIAAEEAARAIRKGLWQQVKPQPPWEFRKEQMKKMSE